MERCPCPWGKTEVFFLIFVKRIKRGQGLASARDFFIAFTGCPSRIAGTGREVKGSES